MLRPIMIVLSILMVCPVTKAHLNKLGDARLVVDSADGARFTGNLALSPDGVVSVSYLNPQSEAVIAVLEDGQPLDITLLPEGSLVSDSPPSLTALENGSIVYSYASGEETIHGTLINSISAKKTQVPDAKRELADLIRLVFRIDEGIECNIVSITELERVANAAAPGRQTGERLNTEFGRYYRRELALVQISFIVHCDNGSNYKATMEFGLIPRGPFTGEIVRAQFVDPPMEITPSADSGGRAAKSQETPPAAALPFNRVAALADNTTVSAYLSQPDRAPTLLYFDENGEFTRFISLPDTASFSSKIELCVAPGFRDIWMAWTDDQLNTKLARVTDEQMDILDLGTSNGPVALACSNRNQALISWFIVNPLNPSVMPQLQLAVYEDTMEQIDRTQIEVPNGGLATNALEISHTGLVALAWGSIFRQPGNGDLAVQLFQLEDAAVPAIDVRGTWLDLDGFGSGQGWFADVTEVNGVPQLIMTFFGYQNGDISPLWLIGQGEFANGQAQLPLLSTSGGAFNSANNPAQVTTDQWGTATVSMLNCGLMRVVINGPDQDSSGIMLLEPASAVVADASFCDEFAAPAENTFNTGFPLTWFDPAKSGEGMFFSTVALASSQQLLVAYYTYLNDSSGQQLWLFGSGPIVNNTAEIPMFTSSGTSFGANFNPEDAMLENWGTISVTRSACDSVTASWQQSTFGDGSIDLQPLTIAPDEQACQ